MYNVGSACSTRASCTNLVLVGPLESLTNMVYIASMQQNLLLISQQFCSFICLAHSSAGWIQLKLAEKANLEIANSKPSSDLAEGKGNQSRVGAAIERLEGSLKKWYLRFNGPFSLFWFHINVAVTRAELCWLRTSFFVIFGVFHVLLMFMILNSMYGSFYEWTNRIRVCLIWIILIL